MKDEIRALEPPGITFGQITVSGDWYQEPERFTDLPVAEFEGALLKRERQKLRRWMALHKNVQHFQKDALDAWWARHDAALRKAEGCPSCALREEALALHYLQDFFSVGHLATPRRNMHDAAAAHLHDHFNRVGLPFRIDYPPELKPVLAALELEEAWNAAMADEKPFHGDSTLEQHARQKTFVEIISAISIAEVLAASNGTPVATALKPCFTARAPRPEKFKMFGPVGGIHLGSASGKPGECNGDQNLGIYMTREHEELSDPSHDLAGLIVRGESGRGTRSKGLRHTTDLLWLNLAEDPGEDLRQWIGAAGFSYTRAADYTAWAFLVNNQYRTRFDGWSWGLRTALRRYTHASRDSWRLDYGGEVVYGVDIVTLRLAIDRGRSIHPNDRLKPDYFVSAGVMVAIPEATAKYLGPFAPVLRLLMLSR
ncbi:MAG TPA: hypothetical protein VEK79_09890 [Thermoanaerobaculia bacterium]|nr:hypothetical protein [Thermoanaerobaculia bacterium]